MHPTPFRSVTGSLILGMAVVAIATTAASLLLLYRTAYQQTLAQMQESAGTLAGIMEAVAQFDLRHSGRDHPQGSWGATMSQIERGLHEHRNSFQTEELIIGRRVDGTIQVMHRSTDKSGMVSVASVPIKGQLAEPLRRALSGERGHGELTDYRGEKVLAGYAPVPSLQAAVVYKIDLAEMRAPHIRAALWASALMLLVIGLGAMSFLRVIRPARRRAEENELRLASILQATPVGVYETDTGGKCVYANDQWRALTGRKSGETGDDGCPLAAHPDDRAAVSSAWESLMKEGTPFRMEYRILHPDSGEVWVYGQAIPLRDPAGTVTGYTGTVTDITRQKEIQLSADLALARLSEAQRIAKVGSWELDLVRNELTWSNEIFRMFEIDRKQFGASYEAFLNAIHPDDREIVNRTYLHSLETRKPYEIVHRLLMPDGRIKYVRETGESFFDAGGKALRSVGTVQDITELHTAEMEIHRHREHLEELVLERTARLTENERRLRRAQEIAHLGHWSVNLKSGELHWSDEIYRIFGRDPAQFLPSYDNFFACVHPDDRARVKASEAAAAGTGRHSVDHRVLRPDGSIRWVHEEAQLERDTDGNPWRLTGTVQDISDRKQAEEELIRARDDAERANRAKSDFLSRMSHELRTPMNAILGFAQVLELEKLNPEQLDFVHEIHRAGDHLLELINELLDLSRIEVGKLATVIQPVSVRSLVNEAGQITRTLIGARQIALMNKCDARARVLADPTRLKQVMVNLLSNAAKYNRRGGRIVIDCVAHGAGTVRLSVTDTGPGIAPEQREHLFKPFERLGAEFSAVDGTGIGLALSRQLAELMGGTLGVDSTPGEGSTFWIDLPVAPDTPGIDTEVPVALPPEAGTGQLRILYVEDNPANLRVVEAMFRHQPHLALLSATNGEFGLELARRYRPDAILLDIHLPGMDGYAVLDILKQDTNTSSIPVIALSADAMPIDIETGLNAGFARYLTKPVKVEALMQALKSVLNVPACADR
jgi:PAS domain S-box-containing protein